MKTAPSDNRPGIQSFTIKFVAACAVLFTLVNVIPIVLVESLNTVTADLLGLLLGLLGLQPSVNGVLVMADGFSVKIITECSAIFVALLFFSFVFAYPASIRQKTIGISVGVPFLFLVNLLRLVLIFLLGMKQPQLFHYAHVYAGQVMMILMVLLAGMVWLRSLGRFSPETSPTSFLFRFIAFSAGPFLLWLYLHKGYVLAHHHLIAFLLGKLHYGYRIPEKLDLFPHTFDTFNMVTFIGLVLATKTPTVRERINILAIGMFATAVIHFCFRLFRVIFLDYHFRPILPVFISFIILNEWILPFAMWVVLVRRDIFKPFKLVICPICGEKKIGILQHIEAKHGETALARFRREHNQPNRNLPVTKR